jgi:hypothetical protein
MEKEHFHHDIDQFNGSSKKESPKGQKEIEVRAELNPCHPKN